VTRWRSDAFEEALEVARVQTPRGEVVAAASTEAHEVVGIADDCAHLFGAHVQEVMRIRRRIGDATTEGLTRFDDDDLEGSCRAAEEIGGNEGAGCTAADHGNSGHRDEITTLGRFAPSVR
jgi:hypothetical protein